MKFILCDDRNQCVEPDYAYNLYHCSNCGGLVKEDVWHGHNLTWITAVPDIAPGGSIVEVHVDVAPPTEGASLHFSNEMPPVKTDELEPGDLVTFTWEGTTQLGIIHEEDRDDSLYKVHFGEDFGISTHLEAGRFTVVGKEIKKG